LTLNWNFSLSFSLSRLARPLGLSQFTKASMDFRMPHVTRMIVPRHRLVCFFLSLWPPPCEIRKRFLLLVLLPPPLPLQKGRRMCPLGFANIHNFPCVSLPSDGPLRAVSFPDWFIRIALSLFVPRSFFLFAEGPFRKTQTANPDLGRSTLRIDYRCPVLSLFLGPRFHCFARLDPQAGPYFLPIPSSIEFFKEKSCDPSHTFWNLLLKFACLPPL